MPLEGIWNYCSNSNEKKRREAGLEVKVMSCISDRLIRRYLQNIPAETVTQKETEYRTLIQGGS